MLPRSYLDALLDQYISFLASRILQNHQYDYVSVLLISMAVSYIDKIIISLSNMYTYNKLNFVLHQKYKWYMKYHIGINIKYS